MHEHEKDLELKRDSKDPRDRQRLSTYEETLKLIRDKSTAHNTQLNAGRLVCPRTRRNSKD
jgi:hypothetical protein